MKLTTGAERLVNTAIGLRNLGQEDCSKLDLIGVFNLLCLPLGKSGFSIDQDSRIRVAFKITCKNDIFLVVCG